MKLAIDPGHGMGNRREGVYDPGAVGGGVAEADVALQWALTGKWILEQKGVDVWLTRDDDRDLTPVGTRDNRAREAGCTRFISIHCNSAGPTATGTETFFRDAEDKKWATIVQKAALEALDLRDRGLKTEASSQHTRLAVLDFAGPACLLELGFISNPGDRTRMLERSRRIAFWEAIGETLKSM